jgi:MoxR-like ATPase
MSSNSAGITAINEEVKRASAGLRPLLDEMSQVVIGQRRLLERLLIGLLSNGHLLLEGAPGLAKTLAIKSLSDALHAGFSRIQFTPDMLPADVIGTQIYNPQSGEFTVKQGPVFANLVLADEINRAPAKVQSALLQAMQERQVTLGDKTFLLEDPFLVLATQNPIEQEGTYPLPEAQLDRFLLKIKIDYPSRDTEREILDSMGRISGQPKVKKVMDLDQITDCRQIVDSIYMDDKVKDYIVDLVCATRDPGAYQLGQLEDFLQMGASPRATIALTLTSKAHAFIQGRGYVTPQDVKSVALEAMRHRIQISYEAEAEDQTSDTVLQSLLDKLPVP